MVLCADLGNLSLNVSLVEDRKVLFRYRTYSDKTRSEAEYLSHMESYFAYQKVDPRLVDGVILSSVVPSLTKRIENVLTKLSMQPCLLLGRGLKTGIAIRMDNPQEVGTNLLAEAVGANGSYKEDLFVADCSSVLSFFVVSREKEYLGGALFPGLRASSTAMVERSAQLLETDLGEPKRYLGKSTKEALNSGVVNGYSLLIDAYARKAEEETKKKLIRVLTGPDSPILASLLPDFIKDPDLGAVGLYDIFLKNRR